MSLIKCPECGREISSAALACPNCGLPRLPEPPNAQPSPPPPAPMPSAARYDPDGKATSSESSGSSKNNHTARNITGAVILFTIFGALGMLHIVQTDSTPTFIPKEHFTFSMTFTSVDEVVTRWNNRSIAEAARSDPFLENLGHELEKRGYLSMKKKTWSQLEDDVRRALPDR